LQLQVGAHRSFYLVAGEHDKEVRYWRRDGSQVLTNQGLQSKGHLPLTGDSRRGDLLRHRKKKSKQGALPSGNSRGRDKTRHGRGVTEQGALINWGSLRERLCQDTERKQLRKKHLQAGDHRGRDK